MSSLKRFAPWVDRIVLAFVSLLFTVIGLRGIFNPNAVFGGGATLNSAFAHTVTRVGFGAFPLSVAVFTAWCLSSRSRYRVGVTLAAILLIVVIGVRAFSIALDGAAPESVRLFAPETVALVLALAGLALEPAAPRAAGAD